MYKTKRHMGSISTESSVGSIGGPPLLPSDSTMSLGSICPSLVRLFNHIRQEGRDNLTKEDLQKLVGSEVDSVQLDQAFENLDGDGDGEVSLDEFIAGFARFWREVPHTPSADSKDVFSFSPFHSLTRKRMASEVSEECYEYCGEDSTYEDSGPTEQFQQNVLALSSHNRDSLEHLWRSLKEANPELLSDFEEFVAEVASEVEGAQRALDNQRMVNKKEAIELDNEIESRLTAAQNTLHIQTNLVRQEEKAKLERRLIAKESELFSVRNQLQELESEIVNTQQTRSELQQQCEDLSKEKEELREKLEKSERLLQETQNLKQMKAMEELALQQQEQSRQEMELNQQKKEYEEEIAKLKKQLEMHNKRELEDDNEEVEALLRGGVARPDLLPTHLHADKGSLMEEIAAKEGIASPLLRKEHVLQPSPFLRARASSARRKKPPQAHVQAQRAKVKLSLSLPNLADIDNLEEALPSNRYSAYLPADEDFPTEVLQKEEGPVTFLPNVASDGGGSSLHSSAHSLEDSFELRCKPLEFIESLATQPDYIFKILVVGNSYVGKSSFLMRLCNRAFSQRYSTTIGVDFYSKALEVDDKIVSLQLWDTAGQERFQSVTKAYYRGAQGVILMYDISQEESFIAVKSWINSIQENVEEMPGAMCLVGNKQDLEETNEREVSVETGETFAKIYGAEFIETSAKTGYNVGNCLLMLVKAIKRHYEEEASNGVGKREQSSRGNIQVSATKEESKCCR